MSDGATYRLVYHTHAFCTSAKPAFWAGAVCAPMRREKQTHIIKYSQQSGFPKWLVVRNLPANAGDLRDVSFIPGSEGSPGGGHSNPLQFSCWTEEPGGLQSIGS